VELYVDGSKAKQENDISYKGLWAMSLYTEGVRTVWMTDEVESGRMGVSNKVLERQVYV
jgi:hypothetical protein